MPIMTKFEFVDYMNEILGECKATLGAKGIEYGEVDRLHNFRQAAHIQGCTALEALGGMMAKHTVSIYDMIKADSDDVPMWTEKIKDSINYLLLLYAMVKERHDGGNTYT